MSRRRRRLRMQRDGPWIGVVGLLVLLWISISTSLYAPWWAVVGVVLLLVPQALLMRRWATTHPARCPLIPLAGVIVWFAIIVAGAQWWGWSA